MPDVKLSQLAATSPASVAAGAALWTPSTHISGLKLEYLAAAQLRVTSGMAFIQSLGYAVDVAAAITKTGLSLAANTWYHVYLFMNAGVPDIEITTTAPATAYRGSARSKSGATTHRYLGSVRTNTANADLIPFVVDSLGEHRWLISNPSLPLRCLANGMATARTTVNLSPAMPVTATHAILQVSNTATDYYCNMSIPGTAVIGIVGIPPGGSASSMLITFPTNTSQQVEYNYGAVPNNGLYIDVVGFAVER